MIYEFRLPLNVLDRMKRPYDESYYEALFISASQLTQELGWHSLVTEKSIHVHLSEEKKLLNVATQLTANLNHSWPNKKQRLTFDILEEGYVTFDTLQKEFRLYSKAKYELFLENPEFIDEPLLFGLDFYLPYEKTPQYFREGVLVERVLP